MPLQKSTFKLILVGLLLAAITHATWFIVTGLSLPLFGDEKFGYCSAINHQAVQGISLLPQATPYDYSFGHPQLHTSIIAIISRVSGINTFGFHSAQLFFNLLLVCLLLFYAFRFSSPPEIYGLLGLLLFLAQPIFLTQLYIVNPEFLLCALLIGVMLSYQNKNYILCAILGIAAVWTKETGVYTLFILAFLWLFDSKVNRKLKLWPTLIITLSIVVGFVSFALIQKYQMGYYLSPLNMSKTSTSIDAIWFRFLASLKFVFLEQNRFWLSAFLLFTWLVKKFKVSKSDWLYLGIAIAFCLLSALLSHPLERYLLLPVVLFLIILIRSLSESRGIVLLILCSILILNILNIDIFRTTKVRDADASYRKELVKGH